MNIENAELDVLDRIVSDLDGLLREFCSEKERQYLTAQVEEGLSHREIAESFGISQQAVNKSVLSGLRKLQRGLANRTGAAA